jgi:hypothetical protein
VLPAPNPVVQFEQQASSQTTNGYNYQLLEFYQERMIAPASGSWNET